MWYDNNEYSINLNQDRQAGPIFFKASLQDKSPVRQAITSGNIVLNTKPINFA